MTELTSMMNIGKEMARELNSVGIGSAEYQGASFCLFLKRIYNSDCS